MKLERGDPGPIPTERLLDAGGEGLPVAIAIVGALVLFAIATFSR